MISDDVLDGYLKGLLGTSDPGDSLHRLLLASASPDDHNAFGLPDKLKTTMYAIDSNGAAEEYLAKVIIAAGVEAHQRNERIYFAGLARECYGVVRPSDEVSENLARRLHADGKLDEHPAAVEATLLYAACRDGRRWAGDHFLTGPRAGTVVGPNVRIGPFTEQERSITCRLVRKLVGI